MTAARDQARGAGSSMVDLLVAVSISGILLLAMAAVLAGTLSTSRSLSTTIGTSMDTALVERAVSENLRAAINPPGQASAIVTATATSLSFYSLLDHNGSTALPAPALVEYTWDSTSRCLIQATTAGTAAAGGSGYVWNQADRRTRCLIRTASGGDLSHPWFTYYPDASTTQPLTMTSNGLSDTDRQRVQSVQFTILVVSPDLLHPAPGYTSSIRVPLTNVVLASGGNA